LTITEYFGITTRVKGHEDFFGVITQMKNKYSHKKKQEHENENQLAVWET